MRTKLSLFLSCLIFISCVPARADDWPQWLGPPPATAFLGRETKLLRPLFPGRGPKILWRTPVGGGFAGPAVVGDRVFVMDHQLKKLADAQRDPWSRASVPGVERVLCLDRNSGKILWTYQYDCPYTVSFGSGPRATPAVDGERVYALGAEGDLTCLDVASGKMIWAHHLSGEKAPTPLWGFAGHPLVDGNKVIVLSCGKNPATGLGVMTAFDKATGAQIWTAVAAREPGYAPPMIFQVGAQRQLIAWSAESVNGLNPETGALLWTQPFRPILNGGSIATPRFVHDPALGDLLLVSTANEGCLVMKLGTFDKLSAGAGDPAVTVFWKRAGKSERKTDALHALLAAPTIRDGHIYGVCTNGELRCLDLKNGDRLWSTLAPTTGEAAGPRKWTSAFLIPLGDSGSRYLLANDTGDIILADLTPQGYSEVSRAHLLDPTNTDAGRPALWSHPAFAGRCIFWRNDREIVCASMSAE